MSTNFSAVMGDLEWPDGRPNPSGIATYCYFIPKSKIVSYPALPDPEDISTATVYEGNFTLATGATWNKLYSTQGTGSVSVEYSGDKDNKVPTNKAELSFPDLNNESLALASGLANSNMIFIIPHFVSGAGVRYAVIGSEHYDAEVTPTGASGSKAGDKKSTNFTVSASDMVALPAYAGTLTFVNGTLDCSTGTFTPVEE